ncbi:DUF4199 domain-containing protein [uncultured Aquimarina sp.]|uniref:DUF4199 domain-containing protein n=1 Tax=uncultured Aquimarina sp. TaxID=575652 RepID=UPI002621C1D3|nr:DUF4199 domain-containing protein [uncultured Aquimarina sp.]
MKSKIIPVRKYIIKYGIVLGIATVIFSFFIYLTGHYTEQNLFHAAIFFLITLSCIMTGLIAFKNNNDKYISLGEALKIGIGISLLGGLIAILWKILLIKVIDPGIIIQLENNHIKRIAEASSDFTQEQIDRKMALTRKSISPIRMITTALISDLLGGFLISLIGGLIIRKKRDPFK